LGTVVSDWKKKVSGARASGANGRRYGKQAACAGGHRDLSPVPLLHVTLDGPKKSGAKIHEHETEVEAVTRAERVMPIPYAIAFCQ
jgi:hypothetical protein